MNHTCDACGAEHASHQRQFESMGRAPVPYWLCEACECRLFRDWKDGQVAWWQATDELRKRVEARREK